MEVDEERRRVRAAIGALSNPARVLLQVVCSLEEDDRADSLVTAVWDEVWKAHGYADGTEVLLRQAENALVDRGLIEHRPPAETLGEAGFRVPDTVLAVVGDRVDRELRHAAWRCAAWYWNEACTEALRDNEAGDVVRRAGTRGAHYMICLGAWHGAGALLALVLQRDETPGTAQALLPMLRQLAVGAQGSQWEIGARSLFAQALGRLAPDASVREWQALLDHASRVGTADDVATVRSRLALALQRAGRLPDALRVAEEALDAEHDEAASRLYLEIRRLQALLRMGQAAQVLETVDRLHEELSHIAELNGDAPRAGLWDLRESILSLAAGAAVRLGRWDEALVYQEKEIESKRARRATPFAIASARFNAYGPLLNTGRLDEAEAVLVECHRVFQLEGDSSAFARVLSTRADLAFRRADGGQALDLGKIALRHAYHAAAPELALICHLNLSLYLKTAGEPDAAVRHGLAAALLGACTGSGGYREVAVERLAGFVSVVAFPASRRGLFDAVCGQLFNENGVSLPDMVASLSSPVVPDDALADALRDAIMHGRRWAPEDAGPDNAVLLARSALQQAYAGEHTHTAHIIAAHRTLAACLHAAGHSTDGLRHGLAAALVATYHCPDQLPAIMEQLALIFVVRERGAIVAPFGIFDDVRAAVERDTGAGFTGILSRLPSPECFDETLADVLNQLLVLPQRTAGQSES